MKSIIKITCYITLMFLFVLNAKRISKECIESYESCVNFMATNTYVPSSF